MNNFSEISNSDDLVNFKSWYGTGKYTAHVINITLGKLRPSNVRDSQ